MEWHRTSRVGEFVKLLLFCICLVWRYSYLIGWITDTILPIFRQLVNVHLNMSKANNFLTNHILLSLWYNGMGILFRNCHHSSLSSQTPGWFDDMTHSCWPSGESKHLYPVSSHQVQPATQTLQGKEGGKSGRHRPNKEQRGARTHQCLQACQTAALAKFERAVT